MHVPQRKKFSYLTDKEYKILLQLDTPMKVQDYVSAIPQNFEKNGESCMSVREVLRTNRAHCIEGALLAALAFSVHGQKPLLLDLEANDKDEDHVIALFQRDGYWGAISKGNHAYVRYRDPIYKSVRELALSYFHEYYNTKGEKTLRGYSRPYNLAQYKKEIWVTGADSWKIAEDLCEIKHYPFITKKQEKLLRAVDPIQMKITKFRVHTR
jgi:hypothetical protein